MQRWGKFFTLETNLKTDLETEVKTFYAAHAFQKTLRPPPTYCYFVLRRM